MKKINKEIFLKEYKVFLDNQIKIVFQSLYPKIKHGLPYSKLYQHQRFIMDKRFMTYQTYVLESPWKHAPFEDFFREFNNTQCSINGTTFTLNIDENFLKTKSKICFNFVRLREISSK
jgi:hypothetical protein